MFSYSVDIKGSFGVIWLRFQPLHVQGLADMHASSPPRSDNS